MSLSVLPHLLRSEQRRYCYYSHFTYRTRGIERLRNLPNVKKLVCDLGDFKLSVMSVCIFLMKTQRASWNIQ